MVAARSDEHAPQLGNLGVRSGHYSLLGHCSIIAGLVPRVLLQGISALTRNVSIPVLALPFSFFDLMCLIRQAFRLQLTTLCVLAEHPGLRIKRATVDVRYGCLPI